MTAALRVLAEQVVEDIRAEGRACFRVHLKVRFVPFFTFNRSRKLAEPTYDPAVIAETAGDLLLGTRRRPPGPAPRGARRDGSAEGRLRPAADPRPSWQPVARGVGR